MSRHFSPVNIGHLNDLLTRGIAEIGPKNRRSESLDEMIRMFYIINSIDSLWIDISVKSLTSTCVSRQLQAACKRYHYDDRPA